MGQIINQHEFKNFVHSELGVKEFQCIHCECVEVWDAIEGIFYKTHKDAGYPLLSLEEMPPCITRQTTEDGKK